jgi:hypothetical protein
MPAVACNPDTLVRLADEVDPALEMSTMKPRAVRIPLLDATVTFNGAIVRLVNISRTGALFASATPPTEDDGRLTLSHAHTTVIIDGRLVRVGVAADAEGEDEETLWEAAIVFTAPPPDEIMALLRRVVSPRVTAADRLRT